MKIDLSDLDFDYYQPPLLVGGKAMEFYELRPAGDDIDFVVAEPDYQCLAEKYPGQTVEVYGDLGVKVQAFELWNSILLFTYEDLSIGAYDLEGIKVISLEKLLFLKTLAIRELKYERDVHLIVEKIHRNQYG